MKALAIFCLDGVRVVARHWCPGTACTGTQEDTQSLISYRYPSVSLYGISTVLCCTGAPQALPALTLRRTHRASYRYPSVLYGISTVLCCTGAPQALPALTLRRTHRASSGTGTHLYCTVYQLYCAVLVHPRHCLH